MRNQDHPAHAMARKGLRTDELSQVSAEMEDVPRTFRSQRGGGAGTESGAAWAPSQFAPVAPSVPFRVLGSPGTEVHPS